METKSKSSKDLNENLNILNNHKNPLAKLNPISSLLHFLPRGVPNQFIDDVLALQVNDGLDGTKPLYVFHFKIPSYCGARATRAW